MNLQFLVDSNLNWNNPVQVIFGVISIITLLIYIVAPIYLVIYFRKNVHKFHLTTYRVRFKEAIDGLYQKDNSAPNYFAIFCFRRLAANLLIVFLPTYSSSQIMLYVFSNQMVIISLGFTNIY